MHCIKQYLSATFFELIVMSERKEAQLVELPFLLSKIAFDSGLSLGLSLARLAQIMTKSMDAGIEKYIELMEQEMKVTREKVKVE